MPGQNNANKLVSQDPERQTHNSEYHYHHSVARQARRVSRPTLSPARQDRAGSLWPSFGQTFWSGKQKNQQEVDAEAQSSDKEAQA